MRFVQKQHEPATSKEISSSKTGQSTIDKMRQSISIILSSNGKIEQMVNAGDKSYLSELKKIDSEGLSLMEVLESLDKVST